MIAAVFLAGSTFAAEINFDFSQFPLGESPAGFASSLTGAGKSGDWKILADEVPLALEPLSPSAPKTAKHFVLAQLSKDPADERFPLLIYTNEIFGDFTLTTRFKCVSGAAEQMAGIAFRLQDANNYYVLRASALGNSFRFYKVVNGERSAPIGPQTPITVGVWHEMSVHCKGNQIRCSLNGKELIPLLEDNSFSSGKIAFWTKSDSVSYFADTKINFVPRIKRTRRVIAEMMENYPRLLGLKIFRKEASEEVKVIASNDEKQIGEAGAKAEEQVIAKGIPYYAKDKDQVSIIMPLKDRNGDVIAAVRVIMKPFPGQTESNVLARAAPVTKAIETKISSVEELNE
ncbi:MAG: family 16 glycoside hydrolase [Verrucomicrobiota bacterium]